MAACGRCAVSDPGDVNTVLIKQSQSNSSAQNARIIFLPILSQTILSIHLSRLSGQSLCLEPKEQRGGSVRAFTRHRPVRKPFPDQLPRERVVVEAPAACTCCGSDQIVKMGEDVTDTLEVPLLSGR